MRCKNCGKYFNTNSFGETYCIYCGVQVDKKDKDIILKKEYIQNKYGIRILLFSIVIGLLLLFLIYKISTYL
jgi:uncharacterized membrane protein YvbJ